MFSIQISRDKKPSKFERVAFAVVGGFIFVVVIGLLFGLLIQFLWNATLAAMFDLPAISYWQAIGLFFLAKFFFGFGRSGHHYGGKYRRKHHRWHRWLDKEYGDESEFANDEMFKNYWKEEGKEAYESFLISQKEKRKLEEKEDTLGDQENDEEETGGGKNSDGES